MCQCQPAMYQGESVGTILTRKRKDGSPAYMARVRIVRDGQTIKDTETFSTLASAKAWVAKRETELTDPTKRPPSEDPPLRDVITLYLAEATRKQGRTKQQVLKAIKTLPIADMRCSSIKSADIVAMAKSLKQGREPATVASYMSHLSGVFAIARPAWGYHLDEREMSDAFNSTNRLGYTGKSRYRERRPTLEELEKLLQHFRRVRIRRKTSVPMVDIIVFAIFSCRRQEEITLLRWDDLDEKHSRIFVRDMKHPTEDGFSQWLELTPEALAVIQRQPRTSEYIFPYTTDAISAAFTRACDFLRIDDLRFHDLRHDGVSRLFELGWSIPKVATVSGHSSWQSLKRYSHIRQNGDKYADWKWKDVV